MSRLEQLQHEWEQSTDQKVHDMPWTAFVAANKPYPFCTGNPRVEDCINAGFCMRDISCDN